jgi:hypothetical protein
MTTITVSNAPVAVAEAPSIYDAIGGRAALKAAVDIFFGRLVADRILGAFFPGGVGEVHRRFVVTLLGQDRWAPGRDPGRAGCPPRLDRPHHWHRGHLAAGCRRRLNPVARELRDHTSMYLFIRR